MKKRETVWQSRAHRRCFGICTVCLSLYIAYTTYLSQSGFLSGGVKTVASLCVFAVLSASLCRLLSEGCERLARLSPAPHPGGGRRLRMPPPSVGCRRNENRTKNTNRLWLVSIKCK